MKTLYCIKTAPAGKDPEHLHFPMYRHDYFYTNKKKAIKDCNILNKSMERVEDRSFKVYKIVYGIIN